MCLIMGKGAFCVCEQQFVKGTDQPELLGSLVCTFVAHYLVCMSHVMRKPVFGFSGQVYHKPGSTATGDG